VTEIGSARWAANHPTIGSTDLRRGLEMPVDLSPIAALINVASDLTDAKQNLYK